MKIVFVIGSLEGGGAERVLTLLANELSKRNFHVTVIVIRGKSTYHLNDEVNLKVIYQDNEIQNNILNKLKRKITRYTRLSNYISKENPDIVISFMVGMNREVILLCKLLNIPIIATEHNNYTTHKSFLTWLTRRWIYKFADAVTVLTKYDYEHYYKYFLNHVHIIANPATYRPLQKLNERNKKVILAVGSLNRWSHKGFDNLIKIFSDLSKQYPDWELQLAGTGEEGKKFLSNIVEEYNIHDKVKFLGFVDDVSLLMQETPIFVLSSRYEGFGMVLVEAMSQGCACISYDCIAGPSEIIEDNISGLLVSDQNSEEMKKSIIRLIDNKNLRHELAKNAVQSIDRFSLSHIGDAWVELITNKVRQ